MSRSRVLGQIFWFHGGLIALEVVERKNRSGYTTKIIPGLYCEKNTDLGYMPKKDPQLDGEKQAQGLRCQIVEHPRRGQGIVSRHLEQKGSSAVQVILPRVLLINIHYSLDPPPPHNYIIYLQI